MGLQELRRIQTVQDLQAYDPNDLLKVIRGADARISELESKLNWAIQQITLLTHRLYGKSSEKSGDDDTPKAGGETPSGGGSPSPSGKEPEDKPKEDKPKKDKKAKIQ